MSNPSKTKARTVKGILRAVARRIREVGWAQGVTNYNIIDETRAACLMDTVSILLPARINDPLWLDVRNELQHRVQAHDGTEFVTNWNDKPGRTIEEVLALIEAP